MSTTRFSLKAWILYESSASQNCDPQKHVRNQVLREAAPQQNLDEALKDKVILLSSGRQGKAGWRKEGAQG